jgi:hypothetical protein
MFRRPRNHVTVTVGLKYYDPQERASRMRPFHLTRSIKRNFKPRYWVQRSPALDHAIATPR